MKAAFARVEKLIDQNVEQMVKTLAAMTSIKSISPESGGMGEGKRADYLQRLLASWGFEVKRYEYRDRSGTKRPSLVVKFGKSKKTLWIIAHIDTVSEGDRSLWKTDPFKAKVVGGRVYGRGTNDNGQGVVGAMYALKALKDAGARLRYNYGLVLAADEEIGSWYGVKKLLKERLFDKKDLFLIPDYGNPRGDDIEISEKGILWLRIIVKGKQVHASRPELGVNAYRNAIRFLNEADAFLHKKYNASDRFFAEPSTFEMTKHEKNLDSINIVPGMEVSYMDCRVLPKYSLDSVLDDIRKIAKKKAYSKAQIAVEIVNREDATAPTSDKSEIVRSLRKALRELRGIRPRSMGLGGGTVAKPFRELGMQAAVWSTQHDMAHEPNEYAVVDYMVKDTKVFAYMCI